MKNWAIYIDIEGFSKIYPKNTVCAIQSLGALMEGIYRIGTHVFPDAPNRLFAHQTGDGFVVVSDFFEKGPEMAVGIGIVLMRSVLMAGGVAKTGISEGEFADIRGCYPEIVRSNADRDGVVRLGRGLMRMFPVMGTALINSHSLAQSAKGGLLLLDSTMAKGLPKGTVLSKMEPDYVVVDWIHTEIQAITEIVSKANIALPHTSVIEQNLRNYVAAARASTSSEWVQNTLAFNHCESQQ